MSWLLTLGLPIPPTTNSAYVSIKGGRRKLSTVGKVFKQQVKDSVARLFDLPGLDGLTNKPLELEITLYMPVINKGWSTGKAKFRYKRVDVSNRVKLLEDALCEALSIDDAQIVGLTIEKRDSLTTGTLVTLYQKE